MSEIKSLVIILIAAAACCGVALGGQTPAPPQAPAKTPTPSKPHKARQVVVAAPEVPAVAPVFETDGPFPQLQTAFTPEQNPRPPVPPRPVRNPRPAPAPRPGNDQQPEPVVVPLARGGVVLVDLRGGDLKITGWDQDKVEATTEGDDGGTRVEANTTGEASHQRLMLSVRPSFRRGLTLTIKVPRYADVETFDNIHGDIFIGDIDGRVRIGAGQGDATVERVGALKVQRQGGDIVARDVKGEVFARGAQGDVMIENAGKSVDVAVATGDVTIKQADGDVRVNSATGDIDIRCVKGRADINTASGSITMVGLDGDVEASTASGDVSFTGGLRSDASYRLKSVSGEVQMVLPPDVPGFNATLLTYTGAIQTDFPLKPEVPFNGPPVNRRLTAVYGNGGAKITLDSFSGEVRIAKGKPGAFKECK